MVLEDGITPLGGKDVRYTLYIFKDTTVVTGINNKLNFVHL